ncbi:hypothetical protein ACFFQF_25425 [Haladaptatus pallidirubidus]|uniref:Uncharacterized protein n=1 Tax=Haladaptatus pallidirubidus TaxID=1008152 RepID=A0AAV3UGD1_9EURY|nr:hypothetical protein [Haladaptatus pallidirubidus]
MRTEKPKTKAGEAETAQPAETAEAGVRMVSLWILLTIALFVLGRRAHR